MLAVNMAWQCLAMHKMKVNPNESSYLSPDVLSEKRKLLFSVLLVPKNCNKDNDIVRF